MTPGREKQIREWAEKDCESQHPIHELLEEIQQLRSMNSTYVKTIKDLVEKLEGHDEWTQCIRGESEL